jgi:hypothetical protein
MPVNVELRMKGRELYEQVKRVPRIIFESNNEKLPAI